MAAKSPAGAHLLATRVPASPGVVVLVLHGGHEYGTARTRAYMPQVLVCRVLAWSVARRWHRATGVPAAAVYRLQYAWTGWDGDGRDALADHAWALTELRARHPELPIAVLGHSMGGRVGVRLAADPNVAGVVGLAPWLPADDPVDHLDGVRISVVQGTRDRVIAAADTVEFIARAHAVGAHITRLAVIGGGHSMLAHGRTWHRLATEQLMLLVSAEGAGP